MTFRFRYEVQGGHTHVRFFANVGKAGEFILRNDEFEVFRRLIEPIQTPDGTFIFKHESED